jgi:RNA polymerase sigma-70 factor (ECF subfamily)
MAATDSIHEKVNAVYEADSRRVLATLIRLLGDFDAAEEALHEAFRAALETWPRDGVPTNPRAWLVSTGRFKAIDHRRRLARFTSLDDAGEQADVPVDDPSAWADPESVEDDRLRLIFTCCHPALSPDAQIALTLREVCGLTTEEIAQAFLTSPRTLAQRIVRAKAKIRDARIPYEVPAPQDLPARLEAVLHVVYLVFNEGYAASSGSSVTRHDLSQRPFDSHACSSSSCPRLKRAGCWRSCCCTIPDARHARRRRAIWFCSRIRIGGSGTGSRLPKGRIW